LIDSTLECEIVLIRTVHCSQGGAKVR